MKRTQTDTRTAPEADSRLDRLVDEALRELPAGPSAAVKARVMEAWDVRRAAATPDPRPTRQWKPLAPRLRPAAALAGTLVVVLGVFFAWQHVNREFDAAGRHQAARGSTSPQTLKPAPVPSEPERQADAGAAAPEAARQASTPPRQRYVTVEIQLPQAAEVGGYLPGAPAGELGDPIAPMTGPPPIAIAPIETAPSVSETARPVTEFPADNQPPAERRPDADRRGGPPQ